jgi:hypothetical protein
LTGDYSPREILEHENHARELLERSEEQLLRLVPLIAAVLAVLAGLSSLFGGRLSERILTLRNEAVLHEVTASDTWAEYQAQSLKAHIYDVGVALAAKAKRGALRRSEAGYRTSQAPLRAHAMASEAQRDEALAASVVTERRKASLDVAVAVYEIAIVLTSVAALTRRPWLISVALLLGSAGFIFDVRALVPAA